MRTSGWIIVIIYTLLLGVSCEGDRCFHSVGTEEKLWVETGYFQKMNVKGMLHIFLVEDTACFVEFEGGSNVLEYVSAVNTDSLLELYNTNACAFFRDYEKIRAFVHYQRLDRVDILEVCELESLDSLREIGSMTAQGDMAEINIMLDCRNFSFYNHRTTGGVFTFSGSVDRGYFLGFYTAKFVFEDLVVRDLYLMNSSLSDMYVNATERLEVRILHRGDIYYSGSPEIIIDSLSGSGRLLPWIGP